MLSLPLKFTVLRGALLALIFLTLLASESIKVVRAVLFDIVTVSILTPLRSRVLFERPEALLKSSDSRFVRLSNVALLTSVIWLFIEIVLIADKSPPFLENSDKISESVACSPVFISYLSSPPLTSTEIFLILMSSDSICS